MKLISTWDDVTPEPLGATIREKMTAMMLAGSSEADAKLAAFNTLVRDIGQLQPDPDTTWDVGVLINTKMLALDFGRRTICDFTLTTVEPNEEDRGSDATV